MQVENIAECSKGSILQHVWPAVSDNRSWQPIFDPLLSGCLRQVLLYDHWSLPAGQMPFEWYFACGPKVAGFYMLAEEHFMGCLHDVNILEKRILQIERTYNIWKQQTRFNWVCSRVLMESATILTPPSTDLNGILLSVRTQYSWRTRIGKKYQHYIDVRGEVLPTPCGTTTDVATS